MGVLPGEQAEWQPAGGMLRHHPAALCRHLQERRRRAITFLFAPAANILALSYTGVALGADFAIARIVLALSFGVGIGMIMAIVFRDGEAASSAGKRDLRRRRAYLAADAGFPLCPGRPADRRHAEGGFSAGQSVLHPIALAGRGGGTGGARLAWCRLSTKRSAPRA